MLLSSVSGCGNGDSGTHAAHVARTSGSAVALSYDERIAVVTNRSVGSVTVLSIKPERGLKEMVASSTQIQLGEGSEPWSAIIGADDNTAYVVLRNAQQVVRIDDLRHNPTVAERRLGVGSEPMGLALSPTGKQLFVANWADGTISMIDTEAFALRSELDLNKELLDLGNLGDLESRPGLAHPRALVITDNGDQTDEDETLFATEFFSQPLPDASKELSEVDRNREGIVYARSLKTGQHDRTIEFSPIMATGFADSNGEMTSCFPNQLYAAAVEGDSLYVTAMCTSPKGPLDRVGTSVANFKTLAHPAVFVANVGSHEETPERTHLLTQVLDAEYGKDDPAYAADGSGDTVRMPLIPNDIAFRSSSDGSVSADVVALGADALFRLDYAADGTLAIGDKGKRFSPLPENGYAIGIASSRRTNPAFSLAYSEVAQLATILDGNGARIDAFSTTEGDPTAAAIKSSDANGGKGVFATGRGAWSLSGQAWSSCETCHPGGGSDGVVWYFARGPRRTPAPFNTFDKVSADAQTPPAEHLMLWGANIDEVQDIEVIVRTVSGGSGALVWDYTPGGMPSNACRIVYDGKAPGTATSPLCKAPKPSSILRNGLNSSLAVMVGSGACTPDDVTCDTTPRQDWNKINAFIRELRRPNPPSNLDRDRVNAGREVFGKMGCGNCHGNALFTVSTLFYAPGDAENGAAPSPLQGRPAPPIVDVPSALGRLRQMVYEVPAELARLNPPALHDGTVPCGNGFACSTARKAPMGDGSEQAYLLLYGMSPAVAVVDADVLAMAANTAAKDAASDQLRCALRDVGTFPLEGNQGIAPEGQAPPLEYRQDGTTPAQGKDGFSVPSLFGLAAGGPYFHAGNARTLEETFDSVFAQHYTSGLEAASAASSLSSEDQRNLIEFLLSLDTMTPTFTVPPKYDFCQTLKPPKP
ncbi:MAG TPA: hypothetical protein VHB79_20015 [Polyangiaceae bacterium]|nr:hypothetical protein [Polyangiaceae bacterium]